ncbi:DUF1206 domain-containing protein [Pseudomonas sp. nanlin1]|uniref:DUF1206 domain-containing protein n=1 Tax=Pseudomonas sp. nanlin1 TaxID=3040605 RepID=UPI00388EBBE5
MSPNHGLVLLARGGYAARGVVYLIIGIFALLAALGSGQPADSHSSLESLLSQPFGHFLVAIVIVGLAAFAAWRVLQALRDVDDHGNSFKGLVIRAGLFVGGVTYGALAFFALGLLVSGLQQSGGGGGGQAQDLLASVLAWDHSNLLVYLAALVPLGVGVTHIIKGWKASFEQYFEADAEVMHYVRPVSQFGLIARGVAFIEIAVLLVVSGSSYQAMHPPGIKDALNGLERLPMGGLLMGVVALGLIAFSVYSFAEAAWRNINMDVPGTATSASR